MRHSPQSDARRAARVAQRVTLLLISMLCIGSGGSLLWAWISPETIAQVRTIHLLGLLGLFLLPVGTLTAMAVEHRYRRELADFSGSADSAGNADATDHPRSGAGRAEARAVTHRSTDRHPATLPFRRPPARSELESSPSSRAG